MANNTATSPRMKADTGNYVRLHSTLSVETQERDCGFNLDHEGHFEFENVGPSYTYAGSMVQTIINQSMALSVRGTLGHSPM